MYCGLLEVPLLPSDLGGAESVSRKDPSSNMLTDEGVVMRGEALGKFPHPYHPIPLINDAR